MSLGGIELIAAAVMAVGLKLSRVRAAKERLRRFAEARGFEMGAVTWLPFTGPEPWSRKAAFRAVVRLEGSADKQRILFYVNSRTDSVEIVTPIKTSQR
jgi:hypothetical protein